MQMFVIINSVRIIINVGTNVKNQLTKIDVIKDSFEMQITMNVNVINYVMLESIRIIKIVNAEKNYPVN